MPRIIHGNSKQQQRVEVSAGAFDYEYPEGLDLKPGSELHQRIIDEVIERANESHDVISRRFDSWNSIDQTLNAYMPTDMEEELVKSQDSRKPISIVFPYTYAIHETLLTYCLSSLVQDPVFQYSGVGPEDTVGAILLEKKIQLDCLKSKVELALHTFFSDSLRYGVGVATPSWAERYGTRYSKRSRGMLSSLGRFVGRSDMRIEEENALLYEGNKLENIDPYLMLPDPGVSIHRIQDGDFFGWIDQTTLIRLLDVEAQDEDYFNCQFLRKFDGHCTSVIAGDNRDFSTTNKRELDSTVKDRVDVIYMYINLIPSEWDLGDSEYPEKWLFAVAADQIVIQAKPLGLTHGMYPVVAAAPDFDGYSVAPMSRLENLHGLQTTIDWLFNSHIANVRKAINDMLIVDPYLINMNDLKSPEPGKLVRTRRPAWGKGVKDGVHQLAITDITQQNIGDTSWIVNWMNHVSGVDESMMGSLRQGGPERLTGQEFSGTRQSALSRLSRMARVISIQAMQDVAYFFAAHTQQLMTQETYVKATGRWEDELKAEYGLNDRVKVSPHDLDIDFDIITRDGSVAGTQNVQAWIQLYQMMLENPATAQQFDTVRVFKHIARELGAKNVNDFVKKQDVQSQVMPDEQVQSEVQKGNLKPVGEA